MRVRHEGSRHGHRQQAGSRHHRHNDRRRADHRLNGAMSRSLASSPGTEARGLDSRSRKRCSTIAFSASSAPRHPAARSGSDCPKASDGALGQTRPTSVSTAERVVQRQERILPLRLSRLSARLSCGECQNEEDEGRSPLRPCAVCGDRAGAQTHTQRFSRHQRTQRRRHRAPAIRLHGRHGQTLVIDHDVIVSFSIGPHGVVSK